MQPENIFGMFEHSSFSRRSEHPVIQADSKNNFRKTISNLYYAV